SFPWSVAVGDFNGDGRPDLAVASSRSNDVSVLLGTGNGYFWPAAHFAASSSPASAAVADIDGDGRVGVAVANSGSNDVSVLLNNSPPSPVRLDLPRLLEVPAASGVAVGDFNQDGLPDVAVTSDQTNGLVSVFLGNGDGTFLAPSVSAAGRNARAVAV